LEDDTWPAGLVVLPSVVRFTTAIGVWEDDDEDSRTRMADISFEMYFSSF
jgi:hypothetical protein